ncbi:MAG TPA: nicotinate phosphoribosyltransferase [Terriglobia bacterium]|nr:nicotinate phosphoribosyltransferase [Terriglobia bacterium]
MDKPIIESLLDVDFYKDTMGQAIFHRHPATPVTFAFQNRHRHIRLADCIDLGRLREQLDHLRALRFTRQELHFLMGTFEYSQPMFKLDYIEFLQTFRLPEYHLDVHDGQLALEFSGAWPLVTRWETLALQVVAELYGEYQAHEAPVDEGMRRLEEKVTLFKANPNIAFSDFGTRRRFSREWQERVVARLAEEFPAESVFVDNKQFRGTSNTLLAMKYGLTPMGTNAHELPMVYSAIYRDEDEAAGRLVSSLRVLEDWEAEYGLGLSVFLPDTYGSDYFFSHVAPRDMVERWKGSRHDSGPPKEYGDKRVEMYKRMGIDPMAKLIVFADGLDAALVDELERYFRGRIQTTFGIGTNLTNDLGPTPLSIVVKPVSANGLPVVKLSDNIRKASGDPAEIERMKRLTGYTVEFAEACRY